MLDIFSLLNKVFTPRAINYEQLIIDNTVGGVPLTALKYSGAFKASIIVETASIRFRIDGKGDPTATAGMLAETGDTIELESIDDIQNFHAIRTGDTSATIDVTYFN